MARELLKKARKHGFTLVELLIVVAIIGVLSTIGVPTFRRMVQKSKKAEAKVTLGGLYTAEQAFLSEYGAYGNHLKKIGFEVDGAGANYTPGFPLAAGCTERPILPATGVAGMGKHLDTVYPSYYTKANVVIGTLTEKTTVYQYNGFAACESGVVLPTTTTAGVAINVAPNVYNEGTGDNNRFMAVSSGVIAPGVNKATGLDTAGARAVDDWTMNDKRVLSNFRDGVR